MTTQAYTFTTVAEPDYLYDNTKVSIGATVAKLIGGYDTSIKVLMHFENTLDDSSSYARVIALESGAAVTYESGGGGYGVDGFFGLFAAASPSTHKFPASADFKLQSTSRFEISIWERNDLNAAFAPYPIMGISDGLGDGGACSSNTIFMQWANNGNDMQFNFGGLNKTFVGIVTNANAPGVVTQGEYSTASLNHLLASYDGATLRLAINGGFHATTHTFASDITWLTNPNLYLYGGRPSRNIRRDEFIFRKDCSVGDIRTANFTVSNTGISAGTGYPQSNPVIEPDSTLSMSKLNNVTDSVTQSGNDSVTYVIRVENINYWWNGIAWYPSNGYPESNTALQIRRNIASFDKTGDTLLLVYLHSADGLTTPEITSLTVDYDALVESTDTRTSTATEFQEVRGRRARVPVRKRTFLLRGEGGNRGKWYKCWNCGFRGNRIDRNLVIHDVEAKLKHSIPAVLAGTTDQPLVPYGNYVNPMRHSVTITGKTNLNPVGFQDVHSILAESAGGCAFCGCLNYR